VLKEISGTSGSLMKVASAISNRRRRGRPPKPRDEVRSERVVSFVTRDEFVALTDLADARDESVSATVHQILRSALTKQGNGSTKNL
jgi:hypothetical protein